MQICDIVCMYVLAGEWGTKMNSETGMVVEAQNEIVTVQMKRASACSRCGACKIWNEQEVLIEAVNKLGAEPGDRVRLDMEAGIFWKALAVLYGLPFTFMMVGFFSGTYLGGLLGVGEYDALVGLGGGVFMAYLSYRLIKAGEPKRKRHRAVVAEVLGKDI